jgi:hypothetical protein
LTYCGDKAKDNGRKRAKEHFLIVQREMNSGLRRDTRPHGAQTAHTSLIPLYYMMTVL